MNHGVHGDSEESGTRRGEYMKRIGVIANCTKQRAGDVLRRLSKKAKALGLELFVDESAAKLLKARSRGSAFRGVSFKEMFKRVEAVMALGGDGTMLRVVRELDGRDIPVIGVNIGGLGFLTSVAEEDLDRALKCLAKNNFSVSVRAVAEGNVICGGREKASYRALNDIVISRGSSSRVITLDLSIDGDEVTSYVCDGIIISTPTGSTGHSLSAGGPILIPETRAFVISLICPHTLSSRPLVVPDQSEIKVRIVKSAVDVQMSVDGQVGRSLSQNDVVKIRRSDKSVRFIHLPGYSYFPVLRRKLNWRGSNV